jgi:hypothetical protein
MYNDGCSIVSRTGASDGAMTMAAKEPSLRNHIGDIMEMLADTTNALVDAEQKLYVPKPQCDNEKECIPTNDSLESFILQVKVLARRVRNQAIEVNSRI